MEDVEGGKDSEAGATKNKLLEGTAPIDEKKLDGDGKDGKKKNKRKKKNKKSKKKPSAAGDEAQ